MTSIAQIIPPNVGWPVYIRVEWPRENSRTMDPVSERLRVLVGA